MISKKTQLRQHVLQNLFGMGNQLTSIDKIMEVVERNADIKDPNAIRDGIIDICRLTQLQMKINA